MDGNRAAQGVPELVNGGGGMSRAERFEDEKRRIIDSCFGRTNPDGSLLESYITHIRIIEDAAYPSSPPPLNSNMDVKKPRIIIVAVRNSGRVRMHKARENATGTFSIGKTWPLDDLSAVESFNGSNPTTAEGVQRKQWAGGIGFIVTIGKPYYWQANSQKEKQFFIASLVKIFLKYTGGKSPDLIGFDEKEKEQLLGASAQPRLQPAVQSRPPVQIPPSSTSPPSQRLPRRPPSREPIPRQPVSQDPTPRSVPQDLPTTGSTSITSQTSRPSVQSRREGSPSSSLDYSGVTPQQSQPSLRRLAADNQSQESFGRNDDASLPPRSRGGMNGLPNTPGRLPDRSVTPASQRAATPDSIISNNKDSMADAPPIPAPLSLPPERRRPPMPIVSDNMRTRRQGSNDDMIPAPLMSPAMRRDDMRLPQRSADREQLSLAQTQTNGFGTASKPSRYNSPQQSIDATTDLDQSQTVENFGSPPPTDSTPSTPMLPPPEPKDEDRPGLGPMIKKKSRTDIANQFRKAATAANAFKPRAGGAAERLREQIQSKPDGPDGITGVVPAPSPLRSMSNDSAGALPSPSFVRGLSNDGGRTGTPDSTFKERPLSPRKNDSIPEVKITVPQSDRPSSIEGPLQKRLQPSLQEKSKTREPRRSKPASERMQKELEALGVDPSLLGGRGVEFSNLLDEFGWVGDGVRTRNIDEMKADIERELNKAQAGGWLSRLDEEDERIEAIKKGIDICLAEVDELDGLLTLYSVELGTLNEDIAYIEAQSQGLQVQAANQKLLQAELKSLLETISISSNDLQSLKTGQWETDLDQIESSLVILFKAMVTIEPGLNTSASRTSEDGSLKSGNVGGYGNSEIGSMRALQEKKQIYRTESITFLQRLRVYMSIKFPTAVDETRRLLERDSEGGLSRRTGRGKLDPRQYDPARNALWKFNPLMLFSREVDSLEWDQLMKSYEDAFKPIYQDQFKGAVMAWKRSARKPTGDEGEILFTYQAEKQTEGIATTARKLTVKRSQTLAKSLRSPLGDNGSRINVDKTQDGRLNPYEVFTIALDDMVPVIVSEQNFLVEFFHLSSLDSQDFTDTVTAAPPSLRKFGDIRKVQPMDPNRDLAKKVVLAMDDLYSFFPQEMTSLIDWAIHTDPLQGVGVMASIERKLVEVEESSQEYLAKTLQKLHGRLAGLFTKFLDGQIRAIEDTKVKISKRKGVISFIRIFPSFSIALETMLISAEDLDIRETVNLAYAKINKSMFESLKAIARVKRGAAKSDNSLEEKEELNYEVLLIENMHHFTSEVETRNNTVLEEWKEKADQEYKEHLDAYLNKVLVRPLGDLLDRVEKVEDAMQKLPPGAAPSSIAAQPATSKKAFKGTLAEYDSKSIKKGIEALRKRIDKHFTDGDDPGLSTELIKNVMTACERKYDDVERRLQVVIRDVYDNDVPIEWTRPDISAAFSAKIR